MADALPISGLTLKTTPADPADIIPIYDSATGQTRGLMVKELNAAAGGIQSLKFTMTSAQILSSFTSPVVLVAAPGAGYAIQLISVAYRLNFNTTAYTTSGNSVLITSTATSQQAVISNVNFLSAATTKFGAGPVAHQTNTSIIENAALTFAQSSSNPTLGDSTMDLYLTYTIITL